MTTLYIAANLNRSLRYALGDAITLVKVAALVAESTRHDELLLSLDADEPLNILFERFVAERSAIVLVDPTPRSFAAQFARLDERRRTRSVHGRPFDFYCELYPRLDGEARQTALCGSERSHGRRNIFEYYLFGQEHAPKSAPASSLEFRPGLIEVPTVKRRRDRSVFIAPHENCQGNRFFTHAFWEAVCDRLLTAGVCVTVNDSGGFYPERRSPRLVRTFLPYRDLIAQVAAERLVLCGNTGAGWVAAAAGTPLLAFERELSFPEYGFARCGVASLVGVLDEPDPDLAAEAALAFLDDADVP